jgi:pyruvate kinase
MGACLLYQVCSSAVKTAFEVGAKMLVVLTESGTTARLISKYRPKMPILVLTGMAEVARQTNGYMRGVHSVAVGSMIGTDSILVRAADIGKERGWVKSGDVIVAIHGLKEAEAGGTNLLKVLTVE